MSETLSALLRERVAASGDAFSLIDEFESVTFAELEARVERVAAGLSECGIGKGDAIAIWLPNWCAWIELQFAVGRLGATAIALNTRFQRYEVEDIVARSRARLLVLSSDFELTNVRDVLNSVRSEALAGVHTIVDVRADGLIDERLLGLTDRVIPYRQLREIEAPLEDAADETDVCSVFTSSGTTSRPKLVAHPQRGVVVHARAVAQAMGYDQPGTVFLGMLPVCGVFGFNGVMGALAGGAPSVLLPSFDGPRAIEAIERHGATHTHGPDEMYRRLFAAFGERPKCGRLRYGGFANFSGDPAVLARLAESHGVSLYGVYGSSEVQALVTCQPLDADLARRSVMGGLPVSSETRIRVRHPDTGETCNVGEPGDLEISGPSVMAEYLYDEEATRAAFTDDGYFRTGDLAKLMPEGGIAFLNRRGDAIRLAGFLVSPREIERYLEEMPEIRTAQVVAAETPKGFAAVAFVIVSGNAELDEAEVIRRCRAALAKYKVPKRVIALDTYPTTPSPNGEKIQRVRLREMAGDILASAPPR